VTVPVGLLGIEYIKTHIFFTTERAGMMASVIQVYTGKLTVVMQRNRPKQDRFEIETYVDEVIKVDVRPGEKLAIPAGCMYSFVNTGAVSVVFARLTKKEHEIDYGMISRVNGMAYYLIAKNARLEMVPNPRYRNMVPVKKVKLSELNDRVSYSPDSEKCLYEEVHADSRRFNNIWI
jgi:oxalate decarboxylase/phosphoglucose isomerase-like protein (cupin superfamily)